MHSVIFTDRTRYAEAEPSRISTVIELRQARQQLAAILRRVRSDLRVVVVRDRTPAYGVHRSYYLTNTLGPMVFERELWIEGREPELPSLLRRQAG